MLSTGSTALPVGLVPGAVGPVLSTGSTALPVGPVPGAVGPVLSTGSTALPVGPVPGAVGPVSSTGSTALPVGPDWVALIHMSVAALLLWSGANWLALTSTIGDVILNAVA